MGRSPGADRPVPRHPEQRHRRVRAARRESGGLSGQLRQRQPDLPLPKRDQHEPVISVSAVSVVVRSTDHDAAIQRYKRLLGPPVPRIAGDVTAGPALVSCVLVSCAPCVEVPLFDLLRRGQREPPGLPYRGSTRFYGGSTRWRGHRAGLRGCGCGAGTGEQQREAVTVLS